MGGERCVSSGERCVSSGERCVSSVLSAAMSVMTLSTNQLANSFTSGADEKSYRSRQEKSVASVFCSKSKENALFLKTKHAF